MPTPTPPDPSPPAGPDCGRDAPAPAAPTAPPRIRSILPCHVVPDASRAIAHLRDKLGFRECMLAGSHPRQFGIVDLAPGQGVHVVSNDGRRGHRARVAGGEGIDVYIRCPDADARHADLLARGADLLSAPVDKPWRQREFEVRDADGFVYCYGQDLTGEWPEGAVTTAPELPARDVVRAAAFLQERLGFEVDLFFDPPRYAIARAGGACLHLRTARDEAELVGNSAAELWDACLECDGLPALVAGFVARGAVARRGPERTEYDMLEWEVALPDGHLLVFAEPVGGWGDG